MKDMDNPNFQLPKLLTWLGSLGYMVDLDTLDIEHTFDVDKDPEGPASFGVKISFKEPDLDDPANMEPAHVRHSTTESDVLKFVSQCLEKAPLGLTMSEIFELAAKENLTPRVVRPALHSGEAKGLIRLDWNRRYHVIKPENAEE